MMGTLTHDQENCSKRVPAAASLQHGNWKKWTCFIKRDSYTFIIQHKWSDIRIKSERTRKSKVLTRLSQTRQREREMHGNLSKDKINLRLELNFHYLLYFFSWWETLRSQQQSPCRVVSKKTIAQAVKLIKYFASSSGVYVSLLFFTQFKVNDVICSLWRRHDLFHFLFAPYKTMENKARLLSK